MVNVAADKYFSDVIHPILVQEGDKLPVSAFTQMALFQQVQLRFEKAWCSSFSSSMDQRLAFN